MKTNVGNHSPSNLVTHMTIKTKHRKNTLQEMPTESKVTI